MKEVLKLVTVWSSCRDKKSAFLTRSVLNMSASSGNCMFPRATAAAAKLDAANVDLCA